MLPRIFQTALAATAISIAIFVLLGYWFGRVRWYEWFTGIVPMSPITAFCVILLGVAVISGSLNGLRR